MRRALLVTLLALVCAAPAAAQTPVPTKRSEVPTDLDGSAVTANAIVHYRTSGPDAVAPSAAATVADAVERSVAKYAELGFPRVIDDGDGKVDVYYYAYAEPSRHGLAIPERNERGRSGIILLNTGWKNYLETVKHEYFHVVQLAIGPYPEDWLAEATASWARWQVDDPPADNFKYYEDYAEPLNCQGVDGGVCAGTKDGYTRWPFFKIFDASFVRDVLVRAAQANATDGARHGFDVMLAELAERGTTLEAALLGIGTQMVQGTLPYANSAALLPVTDLVVAPPATGAVSAAASIVSNHASLRFVALEPSGPCATVPLTLDLRGPADVAAAAFVQRGGDATPLAIGETVVRWNACAENPAQVVLANGTADADGQAFTLTGRVTATPALSGLKAKRKGKRLVITVVSSAAGSLRVALRPGVKRTLALKAGRNRIAVPAPKARRTNVTLTPSVGGFVGASLTRKVLLRTKR